jgi:hypothetical protein
MEPSTGCASPDSIRPRQAAQLAADLDAADRADEWRGEAERTRKAILDEGWNERVGAFTQAFGGDELDASALLISICGFLEPGHHRCWPQSTPSNGSCSMSAVW